MPLSEHERRILAEIETELDHPARAGWARAAAALRVVAVAAVVVGAAVVGGAAAVAEARPAAAAAIAGMLGAGAVGALLLALSRPARLAAARPWHRAVGRARRRWG